MQARVDDAKDSFFFGRPDLQLLQRFCFDRFGWGQAEVDKLLLPVLKVQPLTMRFCTSASTWSCALNAIASNLVILPNVMMPSCSSCMLRASSHLLDTSSASGVQHDTKRNGRWPSQARHQVSGVDSASSLADACALPGSTSFRLPSSHAGCNRCSSRHASRAELKTCACNASIMPGHGQDL